MSGSFLQIPPPPSPVASLIYGDASTMYAYAQDRTDATDTYILSLGQASAGLAAPTIEPVFPVVADPPNLGTPTPPTLETVVWSLPGMPTPFAESLDINGILPEPFDENPPLLIFPGAPTEFTDVAPAAPPIDTNYAYPTLSLSLPAPPALLSLSIATFNGITLPTVDETIPELTAVAPSIVPYTPGSAYTSALLTAMQASLLERITDGGTGLAPSVENAMWDRGREREARAQAVALADLERLETLGFAFAPGVYMDARLKIITETEYTNAGISREVMIEAAKLEQENVKHALQVATTLEGQLISYTNSVEQRLFESARYATEAGISIYNAKVQAYSAYLDAYKTKVAIYEAKIRGELAKVEAYKAEVDAEQAKAQINTALVQQYKVQADVALSAIEVYKAEIAAIQSKAEVERLKITIYGEEVRAYTAKIGAYTANVEAFRALVGAEGTKQEAYKSSVQAYSAQVDSAAKIADARIAEYRGKLEAKTAEWEGYKAAVTGESERARAIAALNSATAETYRAEVSGSSSYNDALVKQWEASTNIAERIAEVGVQTAKVNADLYMTTRSLALDAAKVGAQVSAQLGAAALNAINWSSSVSSSYNTGFSVSNSSAKSISDSWGLSTQYIYSASV